MTKATVTIDAPGNYYVNSKPLYDPNRSENNGCIEPVTPCTDNGNQCGNECEIPYTASCEQLANLFALTLERFKELNSNLNCDKDISKGTTVCEGGTCGD